MHTFCNPGGGNYVKMHTFLSPGDQTTLNTDKNGPSVFARGYPSAAKRRFLPPGDQTTLNTDKNDPRLFARGYHSAAHRRFLQFFYKVLEGPKTNKTAILSRLSSQTRRQYSLNMTPYNPLQYLAMSTCMHTFAYLMHAQVVFTYDLQSLGQTLGFISSTSPRSVGVRNTLKRTHVAHHQDLTHRIIGSFRISHIRRIISSRTTQ